MSISPFAKNEDNYICLCTFDVRTNDVNVHQYHHDNDSDVHDTLNITLATNDHLINNGAVYIYSFLIMAQVQPINECKLSIFTQGLEPHFSSPA